MVCLQRRQRSVTTRSQQLHRNILRNLPRKRRGSKLEYIQGDNQEDHTQKYSTKNLEREIRCIKIRKRKRLFNKAKKTGVDHDWSMFRKLRDQICRQLDEAQDQYIKGILNIDVLKEKPKKFWSFVAAKKKNRSGVTTLKTPEGQ